MKKSLYSYIPSQGKPSKTTEQIFFAKEYPYPPPLADDHFPKKTLVEMGGTPTPLNRKSFVPKKLNGIGGYPLPPPLAEKNPLSSF